jgi:hypothetical protein
MNIRIKEVQIGWDVTVSKVDCDALRLATNAGVISVLPAGEGRVKLSTLDKTQFDNWCSTLDKAGRSYTVVKPAGQ